MSIPKKISAHQAKRELMRQLDASLLAHAAALCGSPSVEQVYRLQGLAETHFRLKNQYRFTSEDVAGLLRYADPLEVADQCRRVSDPSELLPISALLDEMNAEMRFPLAFPKNNRHIR